MAPPEPSRPKAAGSLNLRILSALILAPVVLAAEYVGSPAFEILVFIAAGILAWEWGRMWRAEPWPAAPLVLGAALLGGCGAMAAGRLDAAVAVLGLGAALLTLMTRRPWFAAGTLYLGLPCVAVIWLRADAHFGFEIVIWIIAVVWASDIGAYCAGKAIGGPKLVPRVSPNKTWAGAAGGLAAAALVGAAVAVALEPVADPVTALLVSAFIGVTAQLGDFFESWIKRRLAVKDTGGLIPGHGGLLDRIDSLMAAAVATALMMAVSRSTLLPWT